MTKAFNTNDSLSAEQPSQFTSPDTWGALQVKRTPRAGTPATVTLRTELAVLRVVNARSLVVPRHPLNSSIDLVELSLCSVLRMGALDLVHVDAWEPGSKHECALDSVHRGGGWQLDGNNWRPMPMLESSIANTRIPGNLSTSWNLSHSALTLATLAPPPTIFHLPSQQA